MEVIFYRWEYSRRISFGSGGDMDSWYSGKSDFQACQATQTFDPITQKGDMEKRKPNSQSKSWIQHGLCVVHVIYFWRADNLKQDSGELGTILASCLILGSKLIRKWWKCTSGNNPRSIWRGSTYLWRGRQNVSLWLSLLVINSVDDCIRPLLTDWIKCNKNDMMFRFIR